MRKLLHIFIVPFFMSWSHQYSIEVDEHKNGIVYKAFREIYLRNDSISLIYSINTSILNEINSNNNFLKVCNQTKQIVNTQTEKRLSNANTKNAKFIEISYNLTEKLGLIYNETISNNSTNQCYNIKEILFNLNMTMHRIKHFKTYDILDMISLKNFTADVKNVTSKFNQSDLSFQMDHSFPKTFFTNTKFLYRESNNSIQFGFKIPIFKKVNLFHIYAKPVLVNNKPYIYNSNSNYIVRSPQLTLFSEGMYKNNCFWSFDLQRVFCKIVSQTRDCDRSALLGEKVDIYSECYTKLPITNYVTQINNNLYFTIQSPLELNITCANKTKSVLFDQSSNIKSIFNCSFETQDFFLNVTTATGYKILALSNATNSDTHNRLNIYIFLHYFYLIILCFLLIPNMLFMSYLIAREHFGNEYDEHNTITYTTADPYVSPYEVNSLPRSYRESMI